MPQSIDSETVSSAEVLGNVIAELLVGAADVIKALHKDAGVEAKHTAAEFETERSFLETLDLVRDTMSEERLREVLLNVVRSIRKKTDALRRSAAVASVGVKLDRKTGMPEFLLRAITNIGPSLRISSDEMSVWATVPPDHGACFTLDGILSNIKQRGIVFGVDEAAISDLLDRCGEEVLIAAGRLPKPGQEGRIEYDPRIKERSRTPKLLVSGNVSFKDIDLFAFVSNGDAVATRIPPSPGTPGMTVTGRKIRPLPVTGADFPSCENARVSDQGDRLLSQIDGCVSMENGFLQLEPTVRVQGNVSYKTGDIDSKVSVAIEGDVPSGFSVRSDRDISVGATVEKSTIKAGGSVQIKGGIEGADRGSVEANGDVYARFITNAKVTSLRKVIVESGIVQSEIWAGENVCVNGKDGHIVGGVIDADTDVVADTIGSDMGVETRIRLGRKLDDLQNLIEETESKIEEQESAAEQSVRIIETLQGNPGLSASGDVDTEAMLEKAEALGEQATQNLQELEKELSDLREQCEEGLRAARTVRARKQIAAGTVIEIQGAELTFKDATGPATVVKSGDELVLLPYKEIDD